MKDPIKDSDFVSPGRTEKWPSSHGVYDPGMTPVQYIIEMAVQMKKAIPEPGTAAISVISKHSVLNQLIAAAIQFLPKEENMLKTLAGNPLITSIPGNSSLKFDKDQWFDIYFPNNHKHFRVEINGFPADLTMEEYREHILTKPPEDLKQNLRDLSRPIVNFWPHHLNEIPKPPDEEE